VAAMDARRVDVEDMIIARLLATNELVVESTRYVTRDSRRTGACVQGEEDKRMREKEEPEDDPTHVADAPAVVIRRRETCGGLATSLARPLHNKQCSCGDMQQWERRRA
jgi:hypothetical protein